MIDIKDLGQQTNVDVIKKFVSLEGKQVIDVGCGSLTFSKHLASLGADVLAVDPDPTQAKINRAAPPFPKIEFQESGGDQLPASNATVDGVFFAYSLHHVPKSLYPAVFDEVVRVLKPSGFLYVIEPVDCPWNQVMKLFYDEDQQRADAQQALIDLAAPRFKHSNAVTYHGYSEYDSFEHFADRFSKQSFNSIYSESDVRKPEVQKAFEKLGGPEHRFESPKKVVYLQDLKA